MSVFGDHQLGIPYRQHLVYYQDLRLEVRRHRKCQPHIHSR